MGHDAAALREKHIDNNCTNQISCNEPEQQPVSGNVAPPYLLRRDKRDKEKEAKLSQEQLDDETTETCCDNTDQQQQCSNGRQLMKTWLYNFLPPIVTTERDRKDADPLRGNVTEHRSHRQAPSRSRTVSGRSGYSRNSTDDERRSMVVSGRLRSRDHEESDACRQRLPAASDVVDVQRQCQLVGEQEDGADRRGRRRSPTDDSQLFITDTCLQSHHSDVSRHNEDAATSSRSVADHDDKENSKHYSTASETERDDVKQDEAVKSALNSFNSKLNKTDKRQTGKCLQRSLTGHVIDVGLPRHHPESCKS